MKKINYMPLTIILSLVAALFIGASLWVSMRILDNNIEQRAFTELNGTTQSQAQFLAHSVEQQYAPLESLAAYLSVQENPKEAFLSATEQTNAVVLTNLYCMLGYADPDGNAYSYAGESLGNISARQYFKDATALNGTHAIEYLATTIQVSEPRILFGVPVRRDNNLVGMIFASKKPDTFKDAMFSGDFTESNLTFVTNSNGAIIVMNGSHAGSFEANYIFDEYPMDTLRDNSSQTSIIATMHASQSSHFCTDSEYVSFMPLGISNWYVFGAVERSAITTKYAANIQAYRNAALHFSLLFAIFAFLVVSLTIFFSRKNNKGRELIRRQNKQFQIILSELKSFVFSYDVATQKTVVSEHFEQTFGRKLPEDWVQHLDEKAALYPETDFKALLKAKNEVERTGQSTHIILRAYNKNRELRWFRIIMAPLYNESRELTSLCGMIIDVTERYDEHQAMMMEQEHLTLAVKNLASLVLSCNLTQNKYRVIHVARASTKTALEKNTYDEILSEGASTLHEEDRQRFIKTLSRENLLTAYERGEKKVEIEYKKPAADGKVLWVRTALMFINNSPDGDVYAVALSRDITDGKKYEMLLQKTFDLTVENMPNFVGKWMFKDGDVFLMYANKKYLEFLGTTEESAFGKSIFCGLYADRNKKHEVEKRDILEGLYACETQKKPISSVYRGWKMNGEEYWLKVQASYFEEEDGHSVYYGTVTDMTEQISAQQKLTKIVSELKTANAQLTAVNAYRDLMDYSHSGGMSVRTLSNSGKQRFLYASKGLLNAFGYTEEEYMSSIEDGHCRFQHPDDLQSVDMANRQLNDLGDAFSLEYRVRHKDGHYLWVIEHAIVAAMPNGDKVVTCLTVDISEQKRLEEKLRISQEEYKVAASLSSYIILSYDVASHTYDVISNENDMYSFARAKNDVPEYAIRIGAVAPESADLVRDVFNAIDKGEQRDKCLVALCTAEGNKFWMELSYTIIFNNDGKPLTAILTFDDVTAKMQAEALFNISSAFLNYSKNATKLIVVNLTKRTIRYETEGAHGILAKTAETTNSADAVKYYISRMVVPEDEEACRAFFSADHFLESYHNGTVEESFEYRGYTADNIPHWYNAQTRLSENTHTHDIILYVVLSDIDKQKQTELELMRRAQTDSLTGLLNRESFDTKMQASQNNPINQTGDFFTALVMIDIDQFKAINDTYGHAMGDEALRQVANRIKDSLRGDDIVARFGGDEFIALLPHMPSTEMIEQRCATLSAALNFKLNDDFNVYSSIGISVCPEDGLDFPTLLKKADWAMYQVKKSGGKRYARYNDDDTRKIAVEHSASTAAAPSKKVFARTFGYFDLLIDSIPLHFTNAKEKELLAILIDCNGGPLTAEEAIPLLWKNVPVGEMQKDKYCKLVMGLKSTLKKAGIDNIIISIQDVQRIDTKKLECDYYQFLKGDPEFNKLYHGSYMTNYDWSEETVSGLNHMI